MSLFFSSPIPSDEIPMERPEFNRVLRLILSIIETRQTLLPCLFLSTFPNLQLFQILYMGGTIIPGIAALWEKRGRKMGAGEEIKREREVSHVIAGFHLSSQQSHNRNVLQHLANKDGSPSLSHHSEASKSKHFSPLCR